MSQAPNYTPTTSFAQDETNQASGRATVKTASLDVETANIASSINALNANLKKIQRDDDKLKDLLVEPYALSEQSRAMIAAGGKIPRGAWTTNANYVVGDMVQYQAVAYMCQTAHNAGPAFNVGFWISISGDGSAASSAQQASSSAANAATSAAAASAAATSADTSADAALLSANSAADSQLGAQNAANSIAGLSPVNLSLYMLDFLANNNAAAATADLAAVSIADLGNTADAAKGDALIGVKTKRTGAVATTLDQANEESLSAMRYMTALQIGDVVNSTGLYDMTAALQAAINGQPAVELRAGLHKISGKLVLGTVTRLLGDSHIGTQIQGTHAGVILEAPLNNVGVEIANIYFRGAGCTGLTTDLVVAGALKGYLNQARIHGCDFGYEMAYGINTSMLTCRVRDTNFGYRGTGTVDYTMVAVRSHAAPGGNDTNLNVFERCITNNAGSRTGAAYAWDFFGGISLSIVGCDFEGGGRQIKLASLSQAALTDCWFERNEAVSHILLQEDCYLPLRIRNTIFSSNPTTGNAAVIEWQSGVAAGLDIEGCNFGLEATQYPVYDSFTLSHKLLGNGKLRWKDNNVTGGAAANRLTSGLHLMDRQALKGWANISTGGTGNLDACSDAFAVLTRAAVGDVTLTLSHPAGTSATAICAVACAADADDVDVRAVAVSTTTIRIVVRRAGVALDCVVGVHWAGV